LIPSKADSATILIPTIELNHTERSDLPVMQNESAYAAGNTTKSLQSKSSILSNRKGDIFEELDIHIAFAPGFVNLHEFSKLHAGEDEIEDDRQQRVGDALPRPGCLGPMYKPPALARNNPNPQKPSELTVEVSLPVTKPGY
jgi:hypothetical protein